MKNVNASTRLVRTEWATPTVRFRGTAGEILRGGEGKLSDVLGDPGEPGQCPKGGCVTYD
jgi:hypothetical protein